MLGPGDEDIALEVAEEVEEVLAEEDSTGGAEVDELDTIGGAVEDGFALLNSTDTCMSLRAAAYTVKTLTDTPALTLAKDALNGSGVIA